MTVTDIKTLYDFVLQQMAAESYFEGLALSDIMVGIPAWMNLQYRYLEDPGF